MSFQSNNRKVICKIDGVDDVDAAKCFVGKEIFVKNTELPKLKKGQYYYNDLVGMSVLLKNNSIGVANASTVNISIRSLRSVERYM